MAFENHLFLDEPTLPDGITRFYFVRHALVESSWRSRMYGALDVDLCADTVRNQEIAYKSLERGLPKNALWFSSPLNRALDTAKHVLRHRHDVSADEIVLEDSLKEQDLGKWSGLDHKEFLSRVAMEAHPFWSINAAETPEGGESMDFVRNRVGNLMDRLAAAHPQRNMILFTHGGVIRTALAHALNIPTADALNFTVQNLSRTTIEKIGDSYRVINVNLLPEFA